MNRLPGFIVPLAIIVAFIAGYIVSQNQNPLAGPKIPEQSQVPQPTPSPTKTVPEKVEKKGPSLVRCEPVQFTDDLTKEDLVTSIQNSLKYYNDIPENKTVMFGEEKIAASRIKLSLKDVLETLQAMGLTEEFYKYITNNFQFYKSTADSVHYTGYYLASLNGSKVKTEKYKYPLYKKPTDLCRVHLNKFSFYQSLKEENPDVTGLPSVIIGRISNKTIVPYYTKEEIDYQNKLAGKGLELLWVDCPVDRFFLQVQGSGVVQFEDGKTQMVNFHEKNGQPYKSIGKMLIAKGILTKENVSMKAIREYLAKNPDQIRPVLTHDPSYVFFRKKEAPFGCYGVPVTTYRSIATDRRCYPACALAIVKTEKPIFNDKGEIEKWVPFTRLVLNQDTGGAIKGTGRVDLYCGFGEINEKTAGHMNQENGALYFLLKKDNKVKSSK